MILNVEKAKPATSASRMRMRAVVMAAPWGTADVTPPSPRWLPRHCPQRHARHAAERRGRVQRRDHLAPQRKPAAAHYGVVSARADVAVSAWHAPVDRRPNLSAGAMRDGREPLTDNGWQSTAGLGTQSPPEAMCDASVDAAPTLPSTPLGAERAKEVA